MMSAGPLPETDSYVELSLLDGGSFIGDTDKVHAGVANVKFRMYNWAFCISHGDGERIILWDLGLHDVSFQERERNCTRSDTITGSLALHALR